jgi:hypothetical protein
MLLFPPSLHEWLPEGHLARFLLDVVSALDLSAIYASNQEKDGRGQQPPLGRCESLAVEGARSHRQRRLLRSKSR